MTKLSSGSKTVTAMKLNAKQINIVCQDSETKVTSRVTVSLAECRAHLARLVEAGWR